MSINRFRNVSMQVLFGAMLIEALHAAFKDAVVALDGVCVHIATARIHRPYGCRSHGSITEREIMAAFVGHHPGFFRNIGFNDRDYTGRARAIDME